ncbi:acyl-CoA synthetase short-chain family member 3, mitochondrial-like isoform X2 [Dendronephthya gigantea]|nr:acyl-CoA synthetase short-chain family member 3, mitochondrial-like isoform X2 [Dendronephthya gigantea]
MLACSRIGAIHSVVFGGFASEELGRRIQHAEPKVVITASCGIEPRGILPYKPLVDEALEFAQHKVEKCVIYQRDMYKATMVDGRDVQWDDFIAKASHQDCVPVLATDPIYILYTSGTTGDPKGIVRPSGGHAVVLNWSMKHIFGIEPGEVWWAASDLGWVVGHSYIVYGPLLARATSILFEGKPVGTPDAGAFFRVIEQHNVCGMFTAPTAIRVIRAEDPDGETIRKYNLSHFRNLFLAGEHCDKDTLKWASDVLKCPVLDNWWQTETGWPITAHSVGFGDVATDHLQTTGRPVPGYDVRIINPDLTYCKEGEMGQVVIRLPLPPGVASTLWKNDERFVESYFKKYPGHYDSMDEGVMDSNGCVSIMTRADDVINVAGHRLSTKGIEEALLKDKDVMDAAVVGLDDSIKGHVPFGFLVVKKGLEKSREDIISDAVEAVREHLGPVVAFKSAVIVPALPKTRSGKTLRSPLQKLINGKQYKLPGTVENPEILDVIKDILKDEGYPKES